MDNDASTGAAAPALAASENNLVWIDLEMTGLDTGRDRIIEIATIVTDSSLGLVAEVPVIAIRQPEDVLGAMDVWNRTTHCGSGLLEYVSYYPTKVKSVN